jgi:ADP-heptose:LPS heptosyltransferase
MITIPQTPAILLVQIGHLGDMILLTPLISALRKAFPTAAIDVLASHRNATILRTNPHIRHIFVYRKTLRALVRLWFQLCKEHYTILLDPKDHFSRESNLIAGFVRAEHRVGYVASHKRSAFTIALPSAESNNTARLHVIDRNLNALAVLLQAINNQLAANDAVLKSSTMPELFPDPDSERYTAQQLEAWLQLNLNHNTHNEIHNEIHNEVLNEMQRLVVVNISAGDPSRYWREKAWVDLMNALLHMFPHIHIAINATPADAELAERIIGSIEAHYRARVLQFPSRSVLDAVSLIRRSALLISPDTAAIHIAAAFDVPTIGLYNALGWNADKFAPRSSTYRLLQPDTERAYLLREISTARVLNAAEEILHEILNRTFNAALNTTLHLGKNKTT